jgi:hemoglobin/transferrin/lactoferrin receptor protein
MQVSFYNRSPLTLPDLPATQVATLTEAAVASLPGVISAIDRAQLQRELAMNLRDAVRYEPGVSVR